MYGDLSYLIDKCLTINLKLYSAIVHIVNFFIYLFYLCFSLIVPLRGNPLCGDPSGSAG